MNRFIAMMLAAGIAPAAGAQLQPPEQPEQAVELRLNLDMTGATELSAENITVFSFAGQGSARITMTGEIGGDEIAVLTGRGAAELAPVCRVDFNGDGFVDFFDYGAFIDAFEAGDASADYVADGFVDFFDLDEFVADLERGC